MLNSPFHSSDPVAARASVGLSIAEGIFLLFLSLTLAQASNEHVLERLVVAPVLAANQQINATIERWVAESAQEQAERDQLQAKRLQQQNSGRTINSTTTIINGRTVTTSPKSSSKPVARPKAVAPSQTAPAPTPYVYQQQAAPAFDQKAYDESVAKMKADADARYQDALQKQRDWSTQKSAENAAWLEAQAAKAKADQEAWKAANGF